MKVGIVTTWDQMCGTAIFMRHYVSCLPKSLDIKVFSEKDLASIPNISTLPSISYTKSWSRLDRDLDNLVKDILKFKPDIIHLLHEGNFFGLDEKLINFYKKMKKNKIKTILHFQTTFPQWMPYFAKLDADAYISNHYPEEEWVLVQCGLPEGRMHYIPFGIPIYDKITREEARKEMNLPLDYNIFLVTGFMRKATGIVDIIRGIKPIVDKYPNTLLIFAGYVHYDEQQPWMWINAGRHEAERLDIGDNVLFTKKFHSEKQLYTYGVASDIYLNWRQHFFSYLTGGSIFRSFSAGIPSIVYDCPSTHTVPQGIVKVLTLNNFTKSILKLIEDKEYYNKLKDEVLDLRNKWSWSNISKEYVKIYEKILE